jgi:four helix bundle protein
MTTIKNFEDIESWKKARELAGLIYELTRKGSFEKDFALKNQIRAAAGSVMHNIAEGFEAGYDTEFARFLRLARRSAGEVQSQLYLALDTQYITQDELQRAYQLTVEAKKLINGLISYLTRNQKTSD